MAYYVPSDCRGRTIVVLFSVFKILTLNNSLQGLMATYGASRLSSSLRVAGRCSVVMTSSIIVAHTLHVGSCRILPGHHRAGGKNRHKHPVVPVALTLHNNCCLGSVDAVAYTHLTLPTILSVFTCVSPSICTNTL